MVRSPVLFYQQMLTLLQRKGFAKPPATTPSEFAEQVIRALPSAGTDVSRITELFYKARFGNYRLNGEDEELIQSALLRLEHNP